MLTTQNFLKKYFGTISIKVFLHYLLSFFEVNLKMKSTKPLIAGLAIFVVAICVIVFTLSLDLLTPRVPASNELGSPAPMPTISLAVNPSTINLGQTSTLSWNVTNATTCVASGSWSGNQPMHGSISLSPQAAATYTYTLTCSNSRRSAHRSVTLTVNNTNSAPTLIFVATSISIDQSESSDLIWTATNATSCNASGGWSGPKAVSGSLTISPQTTTTYNLTCSNSNGSVSDSTTVTVSGQTIYQCSDNIDNDGDGLTDYPADPGCTGSTDDDEFNVPISGTTASSVTQYGVTWTFDQPYQVGHFVGGDWWVVPNTPGGAVTITSITPTYSNGKNGWEVNPVGGNNQSFDQCDFYFNTPPALPYVARPGSAGLSIVKGVAALNASGVPIPCNTDPVPKSWLQSAAVLTVLDSVPVNNGATSFRPAYSGTVKTLFSSENLRTNLLPRVTTNALIDLQAPTLAQVKRFVERPQVVNVPDWFGDQIHPVDNFMLIDPYGADISNHNSDVALRIMLVRPGDSEQERMDAVKAFVQAGIDIQAILAQGVRWPANGGHDMGMKLPATFAAVMLDNTQFKNAVQNASRNTFSESDTVRQGINQVLWGQNTCIWGDGEAAYWEDIRLHGSGGGKTCLDPYHIIDGGAIPGDLYDAVTSAALKGSALVVRIFNSLAPTSSFQTIWNDPLHLAYTDRWVNSGAVTQPDPCAPHDGDASHYGTTFGPDGHGGCILDPDLTSGSTMTQFSCRAGLQCGRFPLLQGNRVYSHGDLFVDAMWNAYR